MLNAPSKNPLTPDGRYIVVRGRLWRAANPVLSDERRVALVAELMDARRAVGRAKRSADPAAEQSARAAVNAAKIALGERGAPWWTDGTSDLNRHLVKNTIYSGWYDRLMTQEDHPPASAALALIGTAGWAIPTAVAGEFAVDGTSLERYASVMPAVEINSSFHRPHRPTTYQRWAASVPEDFRFAVKLPKEISHKRKLIGCAEPLSAFVDQVSGLGEKLGALLLQLPPKAAFEPRLAGDIFEALRKAFGDDRDIVCEPRSASWFTDEANACLADHRIARVVADPSIVAEGKAPGGWNAIRYRRLHGAPRVYYSAYDREWLEQLADTIAAECRDGIRSWCIFDNTASGAATNDALVLHRSLSGDLPA